MEGTSVSRRDFLRGAGVVGAAAGALALAGTAGALAPATAAEGEGAVPAIAQLANETAWIPVQKAACPGPRGPIAFVADTIPADQIAATEDHDIIVVGAGIGGLMASLKAADEGADVVCIEKMTFGRACFEAFGAVNAKCQERLDIQPQLLLDEIYRSAYWRIRPEPVHAYVRRSGEATDFWQAMLDKGSNGFVISHVQEFPSTCGMPCLTDLIPTELGFGSSPCLPPDAAIRPGYAGMYVCMEMQEVASQYDNLDIRFETPGVQLIREGSGSVTGVIARSADGSYVQLNARKGVILATGGYDANPALMEAWCRPEDYASSSWWNPGWGTTGDGHLMGIQVGAQMDPCPQPVMNFRWGSPDSFYDSRAWGAISIAILVNGDGNRFVREDLPFQPVSNAQNAQPDYGANCWAVFDETMMGGMDDAAVEDYAGRGWLFEGATPEELAAACGMNPEGLSATIGRYNDFFKKGIDEDFDRDLSAAVPFTGKRYFALTTNSCVLATVGGLTIDGNAQVLDTENKPIGGLYATGNVSGGFFAGNYPRHIPGTSIGRAVTFGYVAAEHAMKGE